jgi:two-component system response regulator HydG
LFLAADGGTLFLDEIGNISPSVQLNLLRVLQEREIKAVGSVGSTKVNVRVLAATNMDLEKSMREGKFRRDLYYRLSVVTVQIPPLRERREDIEPLAFHFMRRYASMYGKEVTGVTPAALRAIMENPWGGNVRELENVMERAVLLSTAPLIDESALAFPPSFDGGLAPGAAAPQRAGRSLKSVISQQVQESEKEALLRGLREAGGNRSRAAKILGISRSSLYDRLKRLDLL